MMVWSRRLLPLAVAVIAALTAVSALARTTRGPLTGTWSGYIVSHAGGHAKRRHIVIVVNARETGGSWKLTSTCQGPLRLDSISNGYHHYIRKPAIGAACAGGDVDCLKRAGANMYDAVTSHLGGEYDASGTLHRVRHR